ncbi:MAG: protoporphyrinogen oxidase [Actinomycetia bacterium]|nr:protoporphyrinogen oxidase [Actinomycetes bacterium]
MSDRPDVIVVGGGLGGLLVACEVLRRGGRPLLLEAGPNPGGVAATIHDQGYVLEPAAGSFLLPHSHLTPILESARATMVPAAAAHRRYVYNRDTLFELAGPAAAATRLVTTRGKLRLLREPWVSTPPGSADESLLAFLERRLGPEVGRLGATLMAHGVFAGDPAQLSARAAYPRFVALEDGSGSMVRGGIERRRSRPEGTPRATVHVAPNGMAGLAAELAAHLGDDFRADWPVESVQHDGDEWAVVGAGEERAASVVVALAPAQAARVVPARLAAILDEAHAAPVAVVGLGGHAADLPVPSGFGALTGPDTDLHILGLLFESSYAPGRSPARHRLLKGIFGGAADPSVLGLSDDDLVELATEEAGRMLDVPLLPSWTRVVRHEAGIPQYHLGHGAWLERLDGLGAELPGLHLAGWGYRGIGVSSLAEDAALIAQRVLTRR